jgi:hypothetical protein
VTLIAPAKRRRASRRFRGAVTIKPTMTPAATKQSGGTATLISDPSLNDRIDNLWMAG